MANDVSTTLDYTDIMLDQIGEASERTVDVRLWFDEAKKKRADQEERWRKNERLYYGQHWHGDKVDLGLSKLVFNIPLAIVETIMPIISDHLPTIDILPRQQNDTEYADTVQARIRQLADSSDLYNKILLAVKDAIIYSNGFLEVLPQLVDKEVDGETIKVLTGLDVTVVDPFTVYPHPWSTTTDDAPYLIFATPMHINDIKHKYDVDVHGEGNLDEYRSFQFTTDDVGGGNNDTGDMAIVIECFASDEDKEAYPMGRFTAICQDKLLFDEPMEIKTPYFMVANYKSPHSFWGIGDTELVRTQVKSLNQVMSAVADNIRLTGNPVRKMSRRLASDVNRNFRGRPGETVYVDEAADFSWENPPSIPGYIQNYIQQSTFLMDTVTGIHDITQGRKPSGVTAASAIEALQEAANTRIRYKIQKEVSQFVKHIGKYILELVVAFDEGVRTIRTNTGTGEFEFTQYDPSVLIDTQFDVDVATGINRPSGRVAQEERALQMFQMGVYGIKELVYALDLPNKQDLIEGFEQRMAQAQAQEQGGEQAKEQEGGQVPQEVMEQFAQLAQAATPGSPEEDQLYELMTQYPQLAEAMKQ